MLEKCELQLGRKQNGLSQAAREYLAHAFFQTRRSEIRQCLARDGEHFLLGPPTDGLIEVMGFVSQRFLSLDAQGVGGLPRFVQEPCTLDLRLICRLAQECRALLLEDLVLVLELVALFVGLQPFGVGVSKLGGDSLLPRIERIEDGSV